MLFRSEALADEALVRNVVDILYRPSGSETPVATGPREGRSD